MIDRTWRRKLVWDVEEMPKFVKEVGNARDNVFGGRRDGGHGTVTWSNWKDRVTRHLNRLGWAIVRVLVRT